MTNQGLRKKILMFGQLVKFGRVGRSENFATFFRVNAESNSEKVTSVK